ncbi:Krr1-domain-containing protein [Massarina eburnea CBS 473.64]|uniref:Krr1-domain-containing protein n=1 Tax=Massarina eburnea CBS 473.64 TaxID=1395130 RepID=A0A6A6S2N1_9PLEO|nr:Krr1-domain-containing protein [Massarina eburnea CBS 473.64]
MAKTKADKPSKGQKRERSEDLIPLEAPKDQPAKKTKLLDDSDDDGEDEEMGGMSLKVNEEYARRFEHNKKREEKQKLEEKYGKSKGLDEDDDSEDSEEGVEEDDGGEFATEALDQEISATLQALRSKDPRIYDSKVKFFRELEDGTAAGTNGAPKPDSMTLKQYHTKNLLEGKFGDEEEEVPQTYAQEQEEARQNLVKEAHAEGEDASEDDDFLVAKSRIEPAPQKERVKITATDIQNADKDPENFLSNYMASRAWVPKSETRFQPLESDDEDEEAAAEEWENAYNLYFEDTTNANEKLVTYARDAIQQTTVRRDEGSGRHKAREAAQAKREAEKKRREVDLARLRKLKVDEMEEKVNKIRRIGGLKGRDFDVAEWKGVLEGDWSDDQWDEEMRKRFGESYYEDAEADSDYNGGTSKKRKNPKKPKFDDDIDIKDLIPNFEDDEEERPQFTLESDDEDAAAGAADGDEEDDTKSAKSSKKRKQERADAKSAARRDRRLIENLVDDSLKYEKALAATSSKQATRFRYRETSPTNFGMTARDILLADDKQLNEFAGLKKLATFRDPEKKKKDKKLLSKKARLRQWRKETFGDAEGPKGGFELLVGEEGGVDRGVSAGRGKGGAEEVLVKEGDRKKRKRKNKGKEKA